MACRIAGVPNPERLRRLGRNRVARVPIPSSRGSPLSCPSCSSSSRTNTSSSSRSDPRSSRHASRSQKPPAGRPRPARRLVQAGENLYHSLFDDRAFSASPRAERVEVLCRPAEGGPPPRVPWWTIVLLHGIVPVLFAIATGGLVAAVQRGEPLAGPLAIAGVLFVLVQVRDAGPDCAQP